MDANFCSNRHFRAIWMKFVSPFATTTFISARLVEDLHYPSRRYRESTSVDFGNPDGNGNGATDVGPNDL